MCHLLSLYIVFMQEHLLPLCRNKVSLSVHGPHILRQKGPTQTHVYICLSALVRPSPPPAPGGQNCFLSSSLGVFCQLRFGLNHGPIYIHGLNPRTVPQNQPCCALTHLQPVKETALPRDTMASTPQNTGGQSVCCMEKKTHTDITGNTRFDCVVNKQCKNRHEH